MSGPSIGAIGREFCRMYKTGTSRRRHGLCFLNKRDKLLLLGTFPCLEKFRRGRMKGIQPVLDAIRELRFKGLDEFFLSGLRCRSGADQIHFQEMGDPLAILFILQDPKLWCCVIHVDKSGGGMAGMRSFLAPLHRDNKAKCYRRRKLLRKRHYCSFELFERRPLPCRWCSRHHPRSTARSPVGPLQVFRLLHFSLLTFHCSLLPAFVFTRTAPGTACAPSSPAGPAAAGPPGPSRDRASPDRSPAGRSPGPGCRRRGGLGRPPRGRWPSR